MAEVVVIDLANVTVDGEPVGSIFDLAWNRPQIEGIQGLTLAALQAWVDARDQAHQTAASEAMAAKDQAHAEELAARDATIADLQAQVQALGGTEQARQLAIEARRQELLQIAAAAQAELAELQGSTQ